jgi:hypothetical protein
LAGKSSKQTAPRPGNSAADKRLLALSVVIFIATAALVIVSNRPPSAGRSVTISPSATPAQVMPLPPAVIANLTAAPSSLRIDGALGEALDTIERAAADCPDYSPERRGQFAQHIAWLRDLSTVPGDIMLALGADPTARLLFGMASYTAIDWRATGRAPDSCLRAIGRQLNALLATTSETPFTEFE